MLNVKVKQLEHVNQFVITVGDTVYFQSYDSLCAKYNRRTAKLVLGINGDYSMTTLKHLKIFINGYTGYTYENLPSFRKLIKQEKNIRIDNKMK